MKRLLAGLAIAVSLLASAAPALAQSTPTPRQMELARELIDASGARQTFETQLRSMFAQMGSSGPDDQKVQQALIKATPQFLDMMVASYARVYTEQELAGIVTFYKSPAGKAMLAKGPQLSQDILRSTLALMPQILAGQGS